ncbi:MAG: RraA family protein [Verrucomicrobiota bacterium JB024]|nr:RraA family protein [Verrucomicrobiota bacterium JB024]
MNIDDCQRTSHKGVGNNLGPSVLDHRTMLALKRWNTPTIYNGWEQVTDRDISRECFNLEPVRDFMPQMGPMVGRAVTVVFEPSNPVHKDNASAWSEYYAYVASVPGPKITVVQDLDKPVLKGAFWGEVNSNIHKSLGCVGTITDGAIRDVDEMTNAGFKALARGMCIGHAFSTPVRWGECVEVFGVAVEPGRLIHADKHGFIVIPPEDEAGLLEASEFMDRNECNTVIPAGRSASGKTYEQVLNEIKEASRQSSQAIHKQFGRRGEW